MNSPKNTILVWGATLGSTSPLLQGAKISAADARQICRDVISSELGSDFLVTFSEDWEKYGHAQENPGLYEEIQLRECCGLIAIIPQDSPMGVNSWESALLLDRIFDTKIPSIPIVLVVPDCLHQFWIDAAFSNCQDLTNHTDLQPSLGPCTSYFANRFYPVALRRNCQNFKAIGKVQIPMMKVYNLDHCSSPQNFERFIKSCKFFF